MHMHIPKTQTQITTYSQAFHLLLLTGTKSPGDTSIAPSSSSWSPFPSPSPPDPPASLPPGFEPAPDSSSASMLASSSTY